MTALTYVSRAQGRTKFREKSGQNLGNAQERPRPFLRPADRLLWIWLCRHWSRWRASLVLIQPTTVLRWHREGYRRHWRRRSGESIGRPRIPRSPISLLRRISSENPRWG